MSRARLMTIKLMERSNDPALRMEALKCMGALVLDNLDNVLELAESGCLKVC